MALTLAGLAVSLALAAIAARSMTSLLYGFRPDYLPTVAAVSLNLLAVAAGLPSSGAPCIARRSGGCPPE